MATFSMFKHALGLGLALTLPLNAAAEVFEDVSAATGFTPEFLANIPAGGIAVADFDRNGWPDIFVSGFFEPNRLYFNQGNGQFQQSSTVNQTLPGSKCSVAAAADYDNDGWVDLYVGCRDQSNYLFRNLAGTGFANATAPEIDHVAVGANSPRTDAVAWGDVDGNGLLDLFIGIWVDQDGPDLNDPANLNRIVLQQSPGQWVNVTAHYVGAERAKLARNTLAAVFSDLNGDGRVDLYVVNDKLRGNLLYRNDGPGCGGWCFSEVAIESGAGQTPMGMGIAVGDVDRDGDWDLYFSSIDEQFFLRGLSRSPMLWQHQTATPLNFYGVGWGTVFADVDNDGWEDAFLAVGSGGFSQTANKDQLFRNVQGQFQNVTAQSGALFQERPTQQAARIDFDRDGRLDWVLGHWNQGYRLYRNISQNNNHWLAMTLEGGGPVNRSALGAVVEVLTPDGGRQRREMRAGESRGSSHEPLLHFGLGPHSTAQVTIRWPDGFVQSLGTVTADQVHHRAYPAELMVFRNGFEP
ncbi:MAG TPA: CRTAC1 family protein [Patescibacteria group bacterium]|nr:CRTAC1 family protein [Patescibacteria group bacterium]